MASIDNNSSEESGPVSGGLMVLICLLFFVLAGGVALLRYWRFGQPLGLDNAYFFQRVWQSVFLDEPHRTLLNTEMGQGLISGRHFEPCLILFRPVVAVLPRMESLLLAQVAIISAGGFGAFLLAKRFVHDNATALMLGTVWLIMPGLWTLGVHDFRTLAIAAPFVVLAHAALVAGRPISTAIFTLLALSCREEVVLLFGASIPAVWFCAKRQRREVVISTICCLLWVGVITLGHENRGGFISPSEFIGGVSGAFVGSNLSADGVWVGLARELGGGIGAGILAPLTLLPILANGMGVVATGELNDSNAVRLFSVAFGTMALVVALGFGGLRVLCHRTMTVARANWLLRVSALGLLLWNGAALWRVFGGDIVESVQVVKGEVRPTNFTDSPWELLLSAPSNQPILTEEAFAPMLADRPELYVSDDWRSEGAFGRVQLHVNVALFRPGHPWVRRLLNEGFVVTREVHGAVLLQREEPAPALPPLMPL